MIIQCKNKKCKAFYEVLKIGEEFVDNHPYAKFTWPIHIKEKKYLGIKCSKCGTINIKSVE